MGKYESFRVGDRATLQRRITDEDIKRYAEVSGDFNPVHLDDEYAAGTVFGKRVAHGMLTAGLISNLLGNHLPGPGTVYLSQTLRFRSPVFPGDLLTASVEITAKEDSRRRIRLRTECRNAKGGLVLDGEAEVMFKE